MRTVFIVILTAMLGLAPAATVWAKDGKSEFAFGTDPAVAAIKPASPVDIKLKRLKDGTYTWELQGSDPDEILRIDRLLREKLNTKK